MMDPISNIDVLKKIDIFNGESCEIYNESDELIANGRIAISTFSSVEQMYLAHTPSESIQEIDISLKDIDVEIETGVYSLKSVIKFQETYISFELKESEFQLSDRNLTKRVDLLTIIFSETDVSVFNKFLERKNELNWSEILIPNGCVGGDTATQADAFESLCQELVQLWGAKSFGAIGKGTDRGRDGTFKIVADSWIPITTNYSNSWILQCKYSDSYRNLEITEIYKEMVKVLMHKPDYYLLMTNRKKTNDFSDWLENLADNKDYYIPYKIVLIERQQLEHILSLPKTASLKRKYFG